MYRFENIEFLHLLWLLPVFAFFYFLYRHKIKRDRQKFAESRLFTSLTPELSNRKALVKFLLFLFAYTSLVIGVANPQIGSKFEEVKRKGVDLMICLDLSNSMNAEDIAPSRIESAKRSIIKLLDKLKGDRVGIVVFGGDAYTQLPITTDYAAAKLMVNSISTDIIPVQGTAIGKALEQAMRAFNMESPAGKAIVVITDGENHEDDPISIAKDAASKGITIHTIGMGSVKGAPIPIYHGKTKTGYRKDREGTTVITRLDENVLIDLADAGKGIFVRATTGNTGLDYIYNEIASMEQAELGTKMFTDYEDRFQYFLGLTLFLLVLEFLIFERKSNFIRRLLNFENQVQT